MNIEEIITKIKELPEFVINKIVSILQEYDIHNKHKLHIF